MCIILLYVFYFLIGMWILNSFLEAALEGVVELVRALHTIFLLPVRFIRFLRTLG
jgi:hypothetical protein